MRFVRFLLFTPVTQVPTELQRPPGEQHGRPQPECVAAVEGPVLPALLLGAVCRGPAGADRPIEESTLRHHQGEIYMVPHIVVVHPPTSIFTLNNAFYFRFGS